MLLVVECQAVGVGGPCFTWEPLTVDTFNYVASGVAVMVERLVAAVAVADVAWVLYALLTIAQRACLRGSCRHRRYAEWDAGAARGCRRLAGFNASRAEVAAGSRARALDRRRSEELPREATRHETESRRQLVRARFWDFMA
jgi:hypothetical protein